MKQQKTTKTIDSYLTSVIEESVKSTLQRRYLQEKEKQDATTKQTAPVGTKGPDAEKLKKGTVSVDDVVEKLNSIRSGKSFKDEKISSSLTKYFDNLDDNEKIALVAFLKGISQIVTGEIEGPQALDPGDKPAGIEMKKTTAPTNVTIKPLVVKKELEKSEKKTAEEDTTGPVPIKPKK